MSSGLLQVFVEIGNLHGTSNFIGTTGVVCSDSVSHNRVQVLSIPVLLLACSEDWTCNLQMIVSLEAQGTPTTVTPSILLDNLEWIFGYYKLNVLTLARITTIMYDFLPVLIFRFLFFFCFNEGPSSKFREGSWVRQTPEEGRGTYRPIRCGNNNKDEDNSPKNLNDKNQQASSQKFRQLNQNCSLLFLSSVVEFVLASS